jgi:hypothetical protein
MTYVIGVAIIGGIGCLISTALYLTGKVRPGEVKLLLDDDSQDSRYW